MAKPLFRLYLITDRNQTGGRLLIDVVKEALAGGVKAVQLREKDLPIRELLRLAEEMRKITKETGAMLFINGRMNAAMAVEADGIHIGQSDLPVDVVRKIVGNRFMIGVSTHNIVEAKEAEKGGADFITFGPIYETPSKLKYGKPLGINLLKEARSEVSMPIFAIGGIKLNNIKDIITAGADGAAVISAIIGAKEPKKAAEELLRYTPSP
ncbi:MAG: thiamine phosphate synthase [Nitrospirae bacterium]|nr:thiamine phosphate synthase [Nitrospirota bacterium]